ncbi:MAG TPA: hypothetical protein VK705_11715 [Ferruginibacter sp.]|nr:hypothetical protein [Ferruginibacter sp.]
MNEFERINMKSYLLEDVFGISRDVPLTYTERENLDNEFVDSLSRQKHIVIYGSSKQGKTCLRKRHLKEEKYVIIDCSNKLNISDLNELILKKAGFKITISEKAIKSNKITGNATGGFNLFAKAEVAAGYEGESSSEVENRELDLDLADVNDVINALKTTNFSKVIFLDDFHHLKKETQKDFAFALKSFYEHSKIIFVIVGVWLEENRLVSINNDLAGRVTSINADKWSYDDLSNVIERGCELLNIKLEESLIEEIISESYGNVYFVQEICHRICKEFKIKNTFLTDREAYGHTEGGVYLFDDRDSDIRFPISKKFQVKEIAKNIINQHSGSYNSFLRKFSQHLENDYDLYRWIIYVLLIVEPSTLENGLNSSKIREYIIAKHINGSDINGSFITKVMESINLLQLGKSIIEYDEANLKINIIDKGFIIWLAHQNKTELLNILNLPID